MLLYHSAYDDWIVSIWIANCKSGGCMCNNRDSLHLLISNLPNNESNYFSLQCWLQSKWMYSPTHTKMKSYRKSANFVRSSLPEQQARMIKELAELWEQEIELLDVERGSVRLYLWCRSERALQVLEEWLDNGHLQNIIHNWFTALLQLQHNALTVRITVRHGHGTGFRFHVPPQVVNVRGHPFMASTRGWGWGQCMLGHQARGEAAKNDRLSVIVEWNFAVFAQILYRLTSIYTNTNSSISKYW